MSLYHKEPAEFVHETPFENLYVIPAHPRLDELQDKLESRFKQYTQSIQKQHDKSKKTYEENTDFCSFSWTLVVFLSLFKMQIDESHLLIRSICMMFDAYLKPSSEIRYSRII